MTSSEPYINPGLPRILASALYDTIVVLGVVMLAGTIVIIPANLLFGVDNPGEYTLFTIYIVSVAALFFIGFWRYGGQTVGMRAWRIRVQRENGENINLKEAVVRFIAAATFVPLCGLGFFWMLFDPEGKTLHDRIAGTRLVLIEKN